MRRGVNVLRARAAAVYVGLSLTTIWRLRRAGDFAPVIHLTGQSIGFCVADLDQWLRERKTA